MLLNIIFITMDRKELGINFLRVLWYDVAEKVVEKAILVYELDEIQANALRKVYLKVNHYYVESN